MIWDVLLWIMISAHVLVALKAMSIGSDFSFFKWHKHGENYLKWYWFKRPTFEDYLIQQEIEEFK